MDVLLSFARAHPGLAAVIGVAILVGGYLLLNRRPTWVKEADKRERELKEQNRDRYRTGRTL